ncbi:DNA-binding MarR family transcriptional regulator [Conyzicola lurida]|uniref:DNA-binding MarR family transcriptional regulator n=1 Tax=Conyzicola lurida TaxID=1172621 RepID=A0A841ATL9_9MICO|nr:MarR family transcriptional regulator [Conyzicola lurida]MBB5844749.1 DNA-binding MarR family transcriptional regulator [Conyzicola lurida]
MTNELAHQLRQTILRLARRVRAERADDAMSDGKLSVLFILVNQGAQTLGSLSEVERVTPPSMNRTINWLVEHGFVSRESDATDGRKVVIDVTDAGRRLVKETRRKRDAWFSSRLATLTPEERATLESAEAILRRLADQ